MFLASLAGLLNTPIIGGASAPAVVRSVLTANSAGTTPTSITSAVNCTGGNLLVTALSIRRYVTTPPSFTYNGTAMTQLIATDGDPGSSGAYMQFVFYLNNPTTGTNNLVVSDSLYSEEGELVSWVISGANSTPINTSNSANAANGPATASITTTVANTLVLLHFGCFYTPVANTPSGFTLDQTEDTGNVRIRSYSKTQAVAGSVAPGALGGAYNPSIASLIAIKP